MNNQNNGGFCTKCGTPHSAEDIFCSKCGNKFANTITPKFAHQAPKDNFGTPQFDDPYGAKPQSQIETAQPQPIQHTSTPTQPQPVQPQFVQPQPVQPQFAQSQPVQPQFVPQQPQHVSQQPQTQFEYSSGAIARWKTACCILLFVAILLIAILPLFSFASFDYDGDIKELEQNNRDSVSVFEILFSDEYSILDSLRSVNQTSEVANLFKSIMRFVGTLLFLILAQIYAINGIVAMCKRDFAGLSSLAFKSIKTLIVVFMLFSIYSVGGGYWNKSGGQSFGLSMGTGSIFALVISLVLVVATIIIASVNNKYSFYMDKKPRYIKKVIAFVGLLTLCIIALSQNAQAIYTWTLNDLFYGISERFFIAYLPICIFYTTVVVKMTKELARVGNDLTYYTFENESVIKARKLKAPSAPNLLANVIFLTLILILCIISASMDYNTYLSFGALISMLLIALGTYIAYAIFNSKENRLMTSNL